MGSFFKRSSSQNFELFSSFSWHVPGVGGMFVMLGWLIAGILLGAAAQMLFSNIFGAEAGARYGILISYPLQFVPAMVASKSISFRNASFDTGYALNSPHFGKAGGVAVALTAILSTAATAYMTDALSSAMPEMPQWLTDALNDMTSGDNLLVNVLSVSVFAPFFEEWLCRGTILRGLLNCERTSKDGTRKRGLPPALAIIISALFFAVIHGNPWQALPAFIIGCLFGYVYYRTGSIVTTMLMHCANNTLAITLSQFDSLKDAETWMDILPGAQYWIVFALCAVFLFCAIRFVINSIPLQDRQGNCDVVPAGSGMTDSAGENI